MAALCRYGLHCLHTERNLLYHGLGGISLRDPPPISPLRHALPDRVHYSEIAICNPTRGATMHGGDLIASVLEAQGTRFLFTLCGGHISPILAGCKQRGIRVIDTRHEATAVFAADAVARLTGRPGVAAVTAGPGLTNTITAIKNAQIAQSPVVLLGGAAATALKGRGALQDIDQMALLRPHVKWAAAARRVAELPRLLEQAFHASQSGVPGPVFLECPIDLLYDQATVRRLYGASSGGRNPNGWRGGLVAWATQFYLRQHVRRLFAGMGKAVIGGEIQPA